MYEFASAGLVCGLCPAESLSMLVKKGPSENICMSQGKRIRGTSSAMKTRTSSAANEAKSFSSVEEGLIAIDSIRTTTAPRWRRWGFASLVQLEHLGPVVHQAESRKGPLVEAQLGSVARDEGKRVILCAEDRVHLWAVDDRAFAE